MDDGPQCGFVVFLLMVLFACRYRRLNEVDRELAVRTFEKNRDFYHPICRAMVEKDLFGT